MVQTVAVAILQWLKKTAWIPWFTQHSATLNRVVAILIAAASASGITWQWHAAQGQFVINGLMWQTVQQGLWTFLAGIISNELVYLGVQTKDQAKANGKALQAPPQAPSSKVSSDVPSQNTKETPAYEFHSAS